MAYLYCEDDWITSWLSQNRALLYSLARGVYIPGLTFDEFVQELSITCWHASKRFQPEQGVQFSTYASVAMWRRIHELRRKAGTKQETFEQSCLHIEADGENVSATVLRWWDLDEYMHIQNKIAVLKETLDELSSRDRDIVIMVCRGFSQAYVAKRCGLSQPTVNHIISQFRNRISQKLEENV